ncbi:hypothetical protein Vretimale_261 [Volvox reticuliferus]|uniref:Uncharacterized protein n=1 Tax=Volvox reticuliferus TaxID=1737510 RepID=A0A8J4D2H4_9CHLO|nr:hypothetical protein Vretifemale_8186 [Volvox reticuliferus]GIL93982.1 hypothetical protein Vretimale_261 [Volvox reticuliferus]
MESFLIAESCPLPIDELKFIHPIEDEELFCTAVADVGEFFPSRKRQAVGDSDGGGPVSSAEPSTSYAQKLESSRPTTKLNMPDYGPTHGVLSGGWLVTGPVPALVQTTQHVQTEAPNPSQKKYIPDCPMSAFCVRGHQLNVIESLHLTPQPAAGELGPSFNGVLPQSSCGRGRIQLRSKDTMQIEVPMAPAAADRPEVVTATEAVVQPGHAASMEMTPFGEADVTDSPLLAPRAAAVSPLDQQQRRLVGIVAPASSSVCRHGSVCGEDTEDGADGADGDDKVNAVAEADATPSYSKRQSSGCPSAATAATASWMDPAISAVADEASETQAISPEPAGLGLHAEHEVCSLGPQPALSQYPQAASVQKVSNTGSAATTHSTSSPPVADKLCCREEAPAVGRRRRNSAMAEAKEDDFEPVAKRPRRMQPVAVVDDEEMDVDANTSNSGGDDKDDEDYVMEQRCAGNLKRAHIGVLGLCNLGKVAVSGRACWGVCCVNKQYLDS